MSYRPTLTILLILALDNFALAAASQPEISAPGAEYHVGPGQKFAKIVDVPWETLNPGDTVFIHWRTTEQGGDYHEKINLTRARRKPVGRSRLVGVKGPRGERPCLNGKDARTRTADPRGNSTFYAGNQERGVLCFSARNNSDEKTPGADYWDVSGLKITRARPANDFTNSFGKPCNYGRATGGLGSPAAGLFVDRGNCLRFVDMELVDNQNGLFASSDNRGTMHRYVHDLIIENSRLYGNGAPNNASVHNAYVEVANWTVRNNYFGPLVKDSGGSHIKDRGANTLIEGNFFDGTAVPLFLDPPEYSEGWMDKQPGFDRITLRNNVLRKDGNLPVNAMDIINVGFGLYGDFKAVRTVDISHNTFVISATQRQNWSFNVIDLMARPQTILWNDNVFLRFVEEKGAAVSGIEFVAKIDPVDAKTVIDIGPNNYLSGQQPLEQQKPGNGSATVKGWDKVHRVDDMPLAKLEATFGINLHDPLSADFGRFDPKSNAWYQQHKAGATIVPGGGAAPAMQPEKSGK